MVWGFAKEGGRGISFVMPPLSKAGVRNLLGWMLHAGQQWRFLPLQTAFLVWDVAFQPSGITPGNGSKERQGIHSFYKQLWSLSYAPWTVLGTGKKIR